MAHQLARRPIVAEAFGRGRLSYSAVRAITRLDRPDPGVDEALVALAESGQASILDIERVVRSYHLYAGQDRPPPDQAGRARGVRIVRGGDGTGQVIVSLSDLEVEEFAAALQAFVDRRYRPRPGTSLHPKTERPAKGRGKDPSRPGDESSARRRPDRRGAVGGGVAAGPDRRRLHGPGRHRPGPRRQRPGGRRRPLPGPPGQPTRSPGLTTLDGRPLHPGDAAMVACDTSTVSHSSKRWRRTAEPGRRRQNEA